MAKMLTRTVHGLRNPNTGRAESFTPGDTLPTWAEELVTNPQAFAEPADARATAAPAEDEEQAEDEGPPARSASKPEWVDYAVSEGVDRDDAESMTKDDLIARFGD